MALSRNMIIYYPVRHRAESLLAVMILHSGGKISGNVSYLVKYSYVNRRFLLLLSLNQSLSLMDLGDQILMLAWPDFAVGADDTFILKDGGALKVIRTGEENVSQGIYQRAEVEIDGVRRRGDVIFGSRSRKGGVQTEEYPYAILHVVHSESDYIYLREDEYVPQLAVSVPSRLKEAVSSLGRGAQAYECGVWLGDIPAARRISILDRLLVERIDRKCTDVSRIFDASDGDWAQTLYTMLFRAMGGNRNREPYMELASKATYNMALRERSSIDLVEALLLGTAGLLEDCYFDDYIKLLNDHYIYLSRKYDIMPMRAGQWTMAGIRAQNRPVTRIVQLASFISRRDFLFDSIIRCRTRADVHEIFDTEVSGYWATHYVPDGTGERCPKRIGPEKADLLAINAIVPVMFAYGRASGKSSLKDAAFDLLADIPAENNSIVRGWSGAGVPVNSAFDSQALLQLRNEYCCVPKCACCPVGKSIIKMNGKTFCFR